MKTRIFVVLFVFLLAAVSPTFAGDLKPFEGWAQPVSWDYYVTYETFMQFLSAYPDFVLGVFDKTASWTPLFFYGQLITFEGHTNVGGKTTWASPQVVFGFATGPEEDDPQMAVIFGTSTMTVANGDEIFSEFQGIWYEGTDQFIHMGPILGGTGRFEDATGSIIGMQGSIKNGQGALILEGTIETVGEAKEE